MTPRAQLAIHHRGRPVSRPLGPAFDVAAARDALDLAPMLFAGEREGTDITRAAQLTDDQEHADLRRHGGPLGDRAAPRTA